MYVHIQSVLEKNVKQCFNQPYMTSGDSKGVKSTDVQFGSNASTAEKQQIVYLCSFPIENVW